MLTLEGHMGAVQALAFSPDGETLASGCKGGLVRLWAPPAEVGALTFAESVQALAFSPDGRYLAAGGADRFLHVWDVRERKIIIKAGPQQHGISAVAFIGPGTILFGIGELHSPVSRSDTLFLIDLPSGKPRRLGFDVVNGIRALAALPDRKLAAWATDRKVLRVQDVSRPPGKQWTLRQDCRAMAMSPDGRRLAVTSDWEVLLFDLDRWPSPPDTLGRHKAVVGTVVFGPDGRTLLSGDWSNVVRLWDVDRATEQASYTWPIGSRVTALAISPDGLRAAVGGDAGTVAVWDLD